METKEFQEVDPQQVSKLILYYYQGLRMWSRVIPFEEKEAEYYVKTVRQKISISARGKEMQHSLLK